MNRYFLGLVILISFFSCQESSAIYDSKKPLNNSWGQKKEIDFHFSGEEQGERVSMFFVLRNNNEYPFSNIYLFTELKAPQGQKIIDTLEYQVAYPDGKWIGSGMGEIKQNTFIYKENIALKDTGEYQLKVKQAMRENPLVGLEDISLIVEKVK